MTATTITIPARTLRTALASVIPAAASKSDYAPILNAIRLTITERATITLTATNRYMVAAIEIGDAPDANATAHDGPEQSVTIPADDVKALIAALPRAGGEPVTLTILDRKIVATLPSATLTYADVDGDYPPVGRLFPDRDAQGWPAETDPIGLSAHVLASVIKCAQAFDRRAVIGARAQEGSALKPVSLYIDRDDARAWRGLIMPARIAIPD